MFLEEAKISLNLKHPNLVRVLDFGQNEGHYFLAMEYVFGKDVGSFLRTSVEKRVYIPIDVACYIIWQCARGLDYAHNLVDAFGRRQGIIHRDISPPNILIGYNGDSKVLDFGIAKVAQRSSSRQNTRSGVLKGKFSYMSPEQASGQPLNPSSDLFSLAIVFWELLTSRSLFFSQDEMETLERVRKADVESPRKHRKEIPEELEKILMKALEKKEKNRWSSCGEFADAIRNFLRANYPRTDARSVAKFLRACFVEDFKIRSKVAAQDGWVDILVSGAADEDLMLDRSFSDADAFRSNHNITRDDRIGFFQRLLYDPRLSSKFRTQVLRFTLFGALAAALTYVWLEGHIDEALKWGKASYESFQNPTAKTTQVATPIPEPIKPVAGSFAHWMNEALSAEVEGRREDLEVALNRAKEINPVDPNLQTKILFFKLSTGDLSACENLSTLSSADQILATAACFEIRGEISRASATYAEFVQKFPNDSRAEGAKAVLNSFSRSVQLK